MNEYNELCVLLDSGIRRNDGAEAALDYRIRRKDGAEAALDYRIRRKDGAEAALDYRMRRKDGAEAGATGDGLQVRPQRIGRGNTRARQG